ncbi:LacI family DNA-binding transcriptional regulator [Cryobacterium sp. SO1]|uniref:LacI family DNA-binding transcriptional regulator n=1 Tax=Cryobacterium sp. SO1 TaxID=1897061 RepID=UPI001022F8E4|nr:LacI family DNA-binding transcriptional regulator [Cryobacterium sp. SO1]RZI35924.1 Lactose operon repressor [Cryobacterium sp. SO1]
MSTRADPLGAGGAGTRGRAATIYDVAQAAGVSHQTVSRFLRGFEGIRPETRERVVQALADLGYRPNLTARSLKSGRSHRIGALTHEISLVGPSRIVEGASIAAREAGYVLDIVSLDSRNPRAIEDSLALITQHDLAGVLALAVTDEMTRAFAAAPFRVPAYVAAESEGVPDDPRGILSRVGIPMLVAHLAELGHRRFVHIAGPSMWSAARNRVCDYEAALEARGLRSVGILHGDWSAASGYRAISELARIPDATAFLAANDQMALGAMLALKERGLRIPTDVSVVGVDDIAEAAFFDPPLTTLRNDFEGQGRAAVFQLLARIENTEVAPMSVPAPELVIRRSAGAAPQR